MKNLMSVGAALLLTTTAATAGGLDRSGQDVGIIFEDGNIAELSYGSVTPSVSGVFTVPLGLFAGAKLKSGNMASAYQQTELGFKAAVNEQLSLALIWDQPFGASVAYDETDTGHPLSGAIANVDATALTAIARYMVNENVSVHGGLRRVTTSAKITNLPSDHDNNPLTPALKYSADIASDSDTGFVAGVAYERSDIALRVAATYSSETSFDNATTVTSPLSATGTTSYKLPQSVNLEFQTGVAADTLVFGSIRWVDWTVTSIQPTGTPSPLVSYKQDSISYNIGVGRRFSDELSGSVSFGYEAATGDPGSELAPTDGNFSIALGGSYDMGNGLNLSGGVRYVSLGNTTTETTKSDFSNNSAIGFGMKLSKSF